MPLTHPAATDVAVPAAVDAATQPSRNAAAVVLWVGLGLALGLAVAARLGTTAAAEYYAAYFLEKSLSVDNVFAFLIIFSELRIPGRYQGRVLWFGVLGALVFRAILIGAGITLIQRVHWIIYPFAGLMAFAAWRVLFGAERERRVIEGACDVCNTWVARVVRVSPVLHGADFWRREGGRWVATPLLVALVVVETTDIVFAFDSIPAVLAVTRNPLIVYASNVMAMLGLRSLYFVLADALQRLRYLRHGLAVILVFTGGKMLAQDRVHITPVASVVIIGSVLLATVAASAWRAKPVSAGPAAPASLEPEHARRSVMTDATPVVPFALASPVEQVFPTLTPAQVGRIAARGRLRRLERGDVLLEPGNENAPFFVITSGRVEVVRSYGNAEEVVVIYGARQFTGEMTMLSGRRGLLRMRATEPSEVIELDRQELMALVQTDRELGEILMRAFMLRRVELIAHGFGDAVLIGSRHSAGTLRVKAFLTRNAQPHAYIDLEQDPGAQEVLDRFHVGVEDVPVLICRGKTVLRNPTNAQVAECLGLNAPLDQTTLRDLVIVGAGPSGLAAAVYGASEGLDVVVLESSAFGGQAGSSSRIENYLGFPTGISGQELATRAYAQAQKFGAQMIIAKGAQRLSCTPRRYEVQVDDGPMVAARTIIVATGATYRRLSFDGLERFEGAGLYYDATPLEAQLCRAEEVIVVGGGNSAGQAAVFLSETARHVQMLVRDSGLAASMSRYLIRRIEQSPTITLRTRTEIVGLEGDDRLERVRWRDNRTGQVETRPIGHVFVMTGAEPGTRWLGDCVTLDAKGFIKTGRDLSPDDLAAAGWPLARAPYLLETSLPGVFAVGDVRAGSMKRVASAVGEGSTAIAFVHQVLRER